MGNAAWMPIASHPKGEMFVAINARMGRDSIRVVAYNEEDEEYRVIGRSEFYAPGVFTHWCCAVPDADQIT
ncbi:MAG: hypothetical protein H7Y62_03075 [Hyphomicrobium sp.]|nr:hypothetical protein [Hyphomicrobium sp.]